MLFVRFVVPICFWVKGGEQNKYDLLFSLCSLWLCVRIFWLGRVGFQTTKNSFFLCVSLWSLWLKYFFLCALVSLCENILVGARGA